VDSTAGTRAGSARVKCWRPRERVITFPALALELSNLGFELCRGHSIGGWNCMVSFRSVFRRVARRRSPHPIAERPRAGERSRPPAIAFPVTDELMAVGRAGASMGTAVGLAAEAAPPRGEHAADKRQPSIENRSYRENCLWPPAFPSVAAYQGNKGYVCRWYVAEPSGPG